MGQYRDIAVTIVGAGKTGLALVRFFAERGAMVTLSDRHTAGGLNLPPLTGVRLDLGGHTTDCFTQADLVVVSPGVPLDIPPLRAAREAGVPIKGEVDVAFEESSATLVGITGTNGKSTTTRLVGEIFKHWGKKTFVGGNLGTPLIEAVGGSYDYLVVELSSFQLELVQTLQADYGLFLNLSPDHLDRYPSMEDYLAAKCRLFKNMTADSVAVLNADEVAIQPTLEKGVTQVNFSLYTPQKEGVWLEGETIHIRLPEVVAALNSKDLRLCGAHNVQNVMAALIPPLLEGCPVETAWQAVCAYGGLPHRMQWVAEYDGLTWYNDSKGTNVGSVMKSLASLSAPVTLIAGGLAKGGDFRELSELVQQRVDHLILMGTDADQIESQLGTFAKVHRVASMNEAVALAHRFTPCGGSVLLSPGCASFDMFDNFAARGNAFMRAVHSLQEVAHD